MWSLYGTEIHSRFILGTAMFPSLQTLVACIEASETEIITVSLKKEIGFQSGNNVFWEALVKTGCRILPNTAGCHSADEAVLLAEMARELFQTNWIKLEVIGDAYSLAPHPFELVKAAEILIDRGFHVFPYCTDDLIVCQALVNAGCRVLMPLGSPIGSGRGLMNTYALQQLRERFPTITLIVDAGIGRPSDACKAMELGFDGILLNTAVAKSHDPVAMANAFSHAIASGHLAHRAGIMPVRQFASPSTPLTDTLFWKQHREPV